MATVDSDIVGLFRKSQPLFTALGDERRQEIIMLLLESPHALTVGQIAVQTPLSQPAVSHHLKILRDAGILIVTRSGTQRLYSLAGSANTKPFTPIKELIAAIENCPVAQPFADEA